MTKRNLLGGASRFAHFVGLSRTALRASEEDDRREDAEDEDEDKEASEDDDTDPKPGSKRGKRSKAEDDDDDKEASEEDDSDPEEGGDDKQGKRGRKAEDEDDKEAADDDEDEMKGKSAVASARRREQARISHIITHQAAARNPVLALSLACDTRMTRKEAVAVLRSTPAAADQGASRHARPDRQGRNAQLGNDAPALKGKAAVDASWGTAFAKAGVATKK